MSVFFVDSDDDIDWAVTEFGAADLGDVRRTARLVALARQLARSPQSSLPQALSAAELKAAYRFFDNEDVDIDGILAAHIAQTLTRAQAVPVVLAIQDTTEYNLNHLPATTGLGYCGNVNVRGYLMHSMLGVTPDGLPLGVLGMKTWIRPDAQVGKKALRTKLPVEEKESFKWIEGLRHLSDLSARCPQTKFVRCASVCIKPPNHRRYDGLADLQLQAVWAIETSPPEGSEAVEWMLLTSMPIAGIEHALEYLGWYARRWTIETWHRVLKSGCRIEARQFGDLERFERATALYAVIAWRILYATMLGRLDSDVSCEILLQRFEWQALYCRANATTKLPKKPPTLAQAVLWIAKLGGYLGRTNDHPPGTTVLWRGFLALHESAQMYLIFKNAD